MLWTKLMTFALALFGMGLMWIYKTWRRDQADTEHSLTLLDVIWVGPARWKTILHVAFLGAVCFFFPPNYLQSAVGASFGGSELGWGLPVIFGIVSERVMLLVFRKALKNGNGKGTG